MNHKEAMEITRSLGEQITEVVSALEILKNLEMTQKDVDLADTIQALRDKQSKIMVEYNMSKKASLPSEKKFSKFEKMLGRLYVDGHAYNIARDDAKLCCSDKDIIHIKSLCDAALWHELARYFSVKISALNEAKECRRMAYKSADKIKAFTRAKKRNQLKEAKEAMENEL